MTPIPYFKLQAKNLFRDYKTQFVYLTDADGTLHYTYKPEYFDMDAIFLDFEDFNEEDFSLMKSQHLLATMLGFKKWSDLLNASEVELELAKLKFDNQGKIPLGEWEEQIADVEQEHNMSFDPEGELEYFKHCLGCHEGYGSPYANYRLDQNLKRVTEGNKPQQAPTLRPDVQITSLPLNETDRAEFIKTANSVFETVMWRMEPRNPELTRKLWNAEDYVDNVLLTEDKLPISRNYALSLIDAFLVHYVLGLAVQADKMAEV